MAMPQLPLCIADTTWCHRHTLRTTFFPDVCLSVPTVITEKGPRKWGFVSYYRPRPRASPEKPHPGTLCKDRAVCSSIPTLSSRGRAVDKEGTRAPGPPSQSRDMLTLTFHFPCRSLWEILNTCKSGGNDIITASSHLLNYLTALGRSSSLSLPHSLRGIFF